MEPANLPPRADDELADALTAALERASLLEWKLEQVTLREKDLWLRLEAERNAVADAQDRVADLTARVHEVESALAEARRTNAGLTSRLAEAEATEPRADPRAERDAAALARAWQREQRRAHQSAAALKDARDRLEVLEHAQVRFHARLTQWQRQVANGQHELDLAEFIAELRAEVLRLGQANSELRNQLRGAPPLVLLDQTVLPASAVEAAPSEAPDAATAGDEAGRPPTEPPGVSMRPKTPSTPKTPSSSPRASSRPPASAGPAASEPPADDLWSPDPNTRRAAAEALARCGDPEARSALLTALPLAATPAEQAALLSHLARAGGVDRDDDLVPYITHDSADVRAAAVDATRSVTLLRQASTDGDPYVRRRALIRWAHVAPADAEATIARAVHDDDPGVRRTACAALAGRAHPAALMALLTAADDPDFGVRTAAIRALPAPLRRRLTDVVLADAGQRRSVLNAIRAERRARVAEEISPNGR